MADLYHDHAQYSRHPDQIPAHPYPLSTDLPYSSHQPHILPTSSSSSNTPSSPESNSPMQTTPKSDSTAGGAPQQQRQEGKQQATFLTKLYALLERPENHHMIRWDPQGEHIIVEKPEQLAIHVLPSVYRQSRFASFSRQLNIYGFMRKVNLRNVDPAIDDPDASTWSHPTLNRHSSADVVANFKRRVPPRIPKSKKRAEEAAAAQSLATRTAAVGLAPMAPATMGRQRAFTAPGSFTPLSQGGAAGWNTSYPRSSIPPLEVPGGSHSLSHGGMFGHHAGYSSHSSHPVHPLSAGDETGPGFNSMPYANQQRDLMLPSSSYPYQDQQNNWSFSGMSNSGSSAHSSGSLSSLLNPSSSSSSAGGGGGGGAYGRPTLNTYASFPTQSSHSPASPNDSRPNTGYSVSSIGSMSYDDNGGHAFPGEYGRPGSSHHRPLSPGPQARAHAAAQAQKPGYAPPPGPGSLSVRSRRRHSQAPSPYPSPYDHAGDARPSSSPQPADDHHGGPGLSRVRSMVQLPSGGGGAGGAGAGGEGYGFSNAGGDFAYSAGPATETMDVYSRSVRPSTSASSLSTASHASSQANTPPGTEGFGGGGTDINRFSPDFGFVNMGEHVPQYAKTAALGAN